MSPKTTHLESHEYFAFQVHLAEAWKYCNKKLSEIIRESDISEISRSHLLFVTYVF